VHHNADNPSQPSALVSPDQQAQADAIVQRLLAPFIAELGEVREELGHTKAQSRAKDETIAELRRRAEVAEAERDRLAAAQAAPGVPGTPEEASGTGSGPESAVGFWARVRRVFGGE